MKTQALLPQPTTTFTSITCLHYQYFCLKTKCEFCVFVCNKYHHFIRRLAHMHVAVYNTVFRTYYNQILLCGKTGV